MAARVPGDANTSTMSPAVDMLDRGPIYGRNGRELAAVVVDGACAAMVDAVCVRSFDDRAALTARFADVMARTPRGHTP